MSIALAHEERCVSSNDPSSIMALSTGYWASQTLLTANRLKLFDVLAGDGKTAEYVAGKLELNVRATTLLLNACVALGLCECDDGNFVNSAASATFLQSSSSASLANAISYSDDLYDTWGDLEQAVRTGIPPKRAETYLGENEEQTRHFVYGMHDRAMAIGRALTGMVDLTGRKRMLDVGGGPGTYSALLTDRYTGLVSDVLELQGVASIANEILKESGADKRVTMMPGDYHTSEFGSGYDVVLMSGMFHRETEANCRVLIQKARDCLEPDGLLVVNDIFADANGTGPEFASLFGLNMMLTAPDGGVHADEDVADWMGDAGFDAIERQSFPPPMPHRVVTGRRG
jgi:cyclopropane fatty-acyl-phospholipid synthase-like methyltransferase